jgi:hypothetical protein
MFGRELIANERHFKAYDADSTSIHKAFFIIKSMAKGYHISNLNQQNI